MEVEMPAGRPAQPAKLKLLKGRREGHDSGNRPVNEGPNFERKAPQVPSWLPDEAKAEWRRVVPLLARYELIKQLDQAALAGYCMAWYRYKQAVLDLEEVGGFSGTRRSAESLALDALSKDLVMWCREFGLTPASEQKLAPTRVDAPDDPFAQNA